MNVSEGALIKEELDQYLGGISLDSLKEATLEACGMKHYSAEVAFYQLSNGIRSMETAALLGDIDATRYLHHIALLATNALARATSPLRSETSCRPELLASASGSDLDLSVITTFAKRLEGLNGSSLGQLHKKTSSKEQEDTGSEPPFLPLSPTLFPASVSLTPSQYSASEIVSSVIREHLSRKTRHDVRHFVGNCTEWPGKYFVGFGRRVTKSADFAKPVGLGQNFPQKNRSDSPDSRAGFGYSVFTALYERKSSPRPHAEYEELIYRREMRELERYLLEIGRQKRLSIEKRSRIVKPAYFDFLLERRWQWAAEKLPTLTSEAEVINSWLDVGTKWIESLTGGDVSSIPWPDYITHRRGVVENPTMSTIRETLKEQFKKIAQLLSEQASDIAADPKLLSKRHQDFNTYFLAKTQDGGRAVIDALKIGGNSHALVQNLEKLAIPQIQSELMKSKPVAKKSAAKEASKKKGKS